MLSGLQTLQSSKKVERLDNNVKVEVKGEISVIIHINLEYALLNSVRVSPLGNAILVYVCTTRKKISFSCLDQELHLK